MTKILDSIPAVLLVLLLLVGCAPPDPATTPVSAAPTADGREKVVAAVIDGREISLAEVDEHLKEQFIQEFLKQPEQRIFEMRETAIRDLVQKHIVANEAAKTGKTAEEVRASIDASVAAPTDEDVAAWYEANKARVRGAPLEDVSPAIIELLGKERRAEAQKAFFEPKLEALTWQMAISPPRIELGTTRLARGADDASVTITVFSDYQCPYCVRAEPVLTEVLERYPKDVRVVHRHFPLDSIHPFARPASEAAMCADEQGKFWEYHDGIFARSGKLADGSFAEIAEAVGVESEAFAACLEERRYKDFVEQDFTTGREAGVTGTPSFFLNGIQLTGARDADELSRQVELELARLDTN